MRSPHRPFAPPLPCAFLVLAVAACSRHSSAHSDEAGVVAPEPSVEALPVVPDRPDAARPMIVGGPGGAGGDVPLPNASAVTPSASVSMSVQTVPQVPDAETVLRESFVPRSKLCYERTLLTVDPAQAGDLVVVLTLASTGQVASVTADPPSPKGLSPVTVSCVLAAARALSFQVSGSATGVTLRTKVAFRRQ